MIKFNDTKFKRGYQNIRISKKYPLLYRYIKGIIFRHKEDLPKILEVNLWAWNSSKSKTTSLSWRYNFNTGIKQDFKIDINLRELTRLYKAGGDSFKSKGREYPGKIRGIRKYILFAILHELGHYQLKQKAEFKSIDKDNLKREIFSDSWAFDKINQGQKEFDYISALGRGYLAGRF